MGLESATTISELDKTYPLSDDDVNRGDDHLRLIKSVLQAQFPGALGAGFNTAILADETELNYLQDATSNIQDQLDALDLRVDGLEATLSAPTGTAMLFYNANVDVPTGWTIDTSVNDSMLRVVSAAAGTSFDTDADSPILMDKVPSHTHAGTTAADGAHQHTARFMVDSAVIQYPGMIGDGSRWDSGLTSALEGSHTHAVTVDANVGAANWTPRYSDVVIAVKD